MRGGVSARQATGFIEATEFFSSLVKERNKQSAMSIEVDG